MRLDNNDDSRRSQSPSQTHANGSSRSSGPKSPLGKGANGDSHSRTESNGSYINGGPVANGSSSDSKYHGHDREEVTRILIQSLTELGYHGAAGALCKESGYQLEGPTVASFRSAILDGDWPQAEGLLFGSHPYDGGGIGLHTSYMKPWAKSSSRSGSRGGLTLADNANRDVMLFWMKQQKYLELLERRELAKALKVLQQEVTPLHQDVGTLHALTSLLMCQTADELRQQARWDGAEGASRALLLSDLSKSISPSIMIPENRLAKLLEEVKENWTDHCKYHNTTASPSLYLHHNCERDDFPTRPVLELKHHKDEVWFVQYSNDGTKLASTSKDMTIIIYETTNYKVLHHLDDRDESGVTHLAWSPDDTKIITCHKQPENAARLWDVKTGACIQHINSFTYPCTTASWTPSGTHILIGSQDDRLGATLWDLSGKLIHNFCAPGPKFRVNDLSLSPNGQRLVIVSENSIIVFDFTTYEKLFDWSIDDVKFTSVTIDKDSRYMLISMNEDKIRLMDIETGELVQEFEGHSQKNFIIRSAFGGADQNFIVSGSEDSKVHIWRSDGQHLEQLEGHSPGCVNSVAWHPTDPSTFASAGDDCKVRIWRPARMRDQ